MSSTNQTTALMHHLTSEDDQKKIHLFQVIEKLKQSQNAREISKVVILTNSNFTADYLSSYLKLIGIKAKAIHGFKSLKKIEKTLISFNHSRTKVLVTNNTDIKLTISAVQHIINYNMFKPNVLYFEANESSDIFHEM